MPFWREKNGFGARNGHIRRSPSQINFKHANFSRRTLWEGSGDLKGQLFFKSRRDEDPGPCFQKNIGLGFWMGFDIWLRLGKNAMKRGWEEGVRTLLCMKRLDPGSVGSGDRAQIELY